MSDPLGLVGGIGRSAPVRMDRTPGGGTPADPGAPSFKDVLMKNLDEVNKLQSDATRAIEDFSTGKRADVEGVAAAVQKADTAFKMLQAVRNKVVQAYEEIQQIRV